jgi:hypothetical protein
MTDELRVVRDIPITVQSCPNLYRITITLWSSFPIDGAFSPPNSSANFSDFYARLIKLCGYNSVRFINSPSPVEDLVPAESLY